MRGSQRRRPTVFLEQLEDRLNLSPSILDSVSLPGANSNWDYSNAPVSASPIIADVNGDGRDDVIVPGGDGNLYAYAYNPQTQLLNRQALMYSTGQFAAQIQSTPVVADIGGVRAVFAGLTNGYLFGWNAATGQLLPGWPQSVATPLASAAEGNQIYGSLAAGDLTGDGVPEIAVTSFNHELTVFRSNGSVLWRFNDDDTVFSGVAIGDLNGDGKVEVVAGGDSSPSQFYWTGGRVNAISATGKRLWVKQTPEVIWSTPVLADLEGNGHLDVVVGTGYSNDPRGQPHPGLPPFPGNFVYALDPQGRDLPGWPYMTAGTSVNAAVFASPAIADLNGDGKLDVVVADFLAQLHAISASGQGLWKTQAFSAQNIYSSPIIADFDGTGSPSVFLPAAGNIKAFAGSSGQPVWTRQDLTFHYSSGAVGHLKGDSSYQLVLIGYGGAQGLKSPSTLDVYNLDPTTLTPPWAQLRQNGFSQAVARPDSFSTALINNLFQNALGRQATSGDLAAWLPVFRRAESLGTAILSVLGSAEARTLQINKWYQTWLGRNASPADVNVWLQNLAHGATYAASQVVFAASDEAFLRAGNTNFLWIKSLYMKILQRQTPPADSEVQSWVDKMAKFGYTRTQMAGYFFVSDEQTNLQIRQWYQAYQPGGLTKPGPDNLAQAGWDLRRGPHAAWDKRQAPYEERMITDILTSNGDYVSTQEEGAWVRAVFQDVLQRAATPAEVASWVSYFDNGLRLQPAPRPLAVSMGNLAGALTHSSDANRVLVISYFQKYLGRNPNTTELSSGLSNLNSGGSRNQFLLGILSSNDYYFNRAGGNVDGFINRVFNDLFGHAPDPGQLATWRPYGVNVRTALPHFALFTFPNEYYQTLISSWYLLFLRRLPNTPSDSARLWPVGTPFLAQDKVNALVVGANQADMQASILASQEYMSLALNKAFWLGARWLS